MTGRLRSLAGQAADDAPGTTADWMRSRKRLGALAPDMARLLADMADFFDEHTMHTHSPAALLARFREIEERA